MSFSGATKWFTGLFLRDFQQPSQPFSCEFFLCWNFMLLQYCYMYLDEISAIYGCVFLVVLLVSIHGRSEVNFHEFRQCIVKVIMWQLFFGLQIISSCRWPTGDIFRQPLPTFKLSFCLAFGFFQTISDNFGIQTVVP